MPAAFGHNNCDCDCPLHEERALFFLVGLIRALTNN